MQEEIVKQLSELKGRRTTMEIVQVKFGDKTYNREIVHRPPASVAIVKIAGNDKYVFIKQFRTPIGREIIEAVAGCVDDGEDPKIAIAREVEEETGYDVIECHHLASFFASPGYSDEIIHAYYVDVDPRVGEQSLDDEERLKVIKLTSNQIQEEIKCPSMGIIDGKTLLAWQAYYLSAGLFL